MGQARQRTDVCDRIPAHIEIPQVHQAFQRSDIGYLIVSQIEVPYVHQTGQTRYVFYLHCRRGKDSTNAVKPSNAVRSLTWVLSSSRCVSCVKPANALISLTGVLFRSRRVRFVKSARATVPSTPVSLKSSVSKFVKPVNCVAVAHFSSPFNLSSINASNPAKGPMSTTEYCPISRTVRFVLSAKAAIVSTGVFPILTYRNAFIPARASITWILVLRILSDCRFAAFANGMISLDQGIVQIERLQSPSAPTKKSMSAIWVWSR